MSLIDLVLQYRKEKEIYIDILPWLETEVKKIKYPDYKTIGVELVQGLSDKIGYIAMVFPSNRREYLGLIERLEKAIENKIYEKTPDHSAGMSTKEAKDLAHTIVDTIRKSIEEKFNVPKTEKEVTDLITKVIEKCNECGSAEPIAPDIAALLPDYINEVSELTGVKAEVLGKPKKATSLLDDDLLSELRQELNELRPESKPVKKISISEDDIRYYRVGDTVGIRNSYDGRRGLMKREITRILPNHIELYCEGRTGTYYPEDLRIAEFNYQKGDYVEMNEDIVGLQKGSWGIIRDIDHDYSGIDFYEVNGVQHLIPIQHDIKSSCLKRIAPVEATK